MHWREVARFDAPSFARSFELYEGEFYVGLGTAASSLNHASGDIYLVMPQAP